MASMIIETSGRVRNAYPAPENHPSFSLEELQEAVGGYIERVVLPDGRPMYINEEGRCKGLPVNFLATKLAGIMIVGDVLIIDTALNPEE